MAEVILVDRDTRDYLDEVLGQDLENDMSVDDQIPRVEKAQKDLMVHGKLVYGI